MNIDDEILQDFLVEAGELYDLLNDQLSELESNAGDEELLNAIFRAFHTIKGGAGFMKLTAMVEVCHRAEDVFDLLRNHKIQVDAGLVDVIFQVLDVLGDMFESVRESEELESASAELLQNLDSYISTAKTAEAPVEIAGTVSQTDAAVSMDDEFEQMRQNALNTKQETVSTEPDKATTGDLITDDEFDNLLDEIHGKGKHITIAEDNSAKAETVAADNGLISDDEFEAMLDQMHGKNKGPSCSKTAEPVEAVKVEPAKAKVTEAKTAPQIQQTKKEKKPSKKAQPQKDSSVRVDTERLDDIMNLVGELVLVKNRLSTLKQTVNQEHVEEAITTLELVTADLQSSVMKTRMQPIKKVFSRFPRVIRDLARKTE